MKKALYVLIALLAVITILLLAGKKTLSTEIIINASADQVWNELTDFPAYPRWNPFILKISGDVKTGNKIQATIKPAGGEPMIFEPVVLLFEKNKILQWEGRLLLPGVFTGKHTFTLIRIDDHTTKFIQKEDFSGVLVPMFDLTPTLRGFESMNNILKKRAER